MFEQFLASAAWAAVKAAVFAILDMLGIRKRAADDGAEQQRAVNDSANQTKVEEAAKRHADSGDQTDDELRARARRDWM